MFKIVASNLDVHDLCIYNLNTIFINKKKKKNRKINERKIKKDKIELFKEIIIIQGTIKQSERVKRSGEAIVERGPAQNLGKRTDRILKRVQIPQGRKVQLHFYSLN